MLKLKGRRSSSKLPAFVELLLWRPLITIQMAAKHLKVSQQAVATMIPQLGSTPRELTDRASYRTWHTVIEHSKKNGKYQVDDPNLFKPGMRVRTNKLMTLRWSRSAQLMRVGWNGAAYAEARLLGHAPSLYNALGSPGPHELL